MDSKMKQTNKIQQDLSLASTEAKPEGANSWWLSAHRTLPSRLKGKLFLTGNQSGTPPQFPGH